MSVAVPLVATFAITAKTAGTNDAVLDKRTLLSRSLVCLATSSSSCTRLLRAVHRRDLSVTAVDKRHRKQRVQDVQECRATRATVEARDPCGHSAPTTAHPAVPSSARAACEHEGSVLRFPGPVDRADEGKPMSTITCTAVVLAEDPCERADGRRRVPGCWMGRRPPGGATPSTCAPSPPGAGKPAQPCRGQTVPPRAVRGWIEETRRM